MASSGDAWRDTTPTDDDRLPWLESVDDDYDDGVSAGRLATLIVAALVALGLLIGGVWWLRSRSAPPVDPKLITAEKGDYKVKPDAPGGMKVEGKGDSAFAASEGAEAAGKVDTNQQPESPVKGTRAVATAEKATPAATVGVPKSTAPLVAKPPVTGTAAAMSGSGVVQLGAYGSQAKADAGWAEIAKQNAWLAGMSKAVVPAEVGGRTVYRLRVNAGGQASAVCARLKAAGQNCILAN